MTAVVQRLALLPQKMNTPPYVSIQLQTLGFGSAFACLLVFVLFVRTSCFGCLNVSPTHFHALIQLKKDSPSVPPAQTRPRPVQMHVKIPCLYVTVKCSRMVICLPVQDPEQLCGSSEDQPGFGGQDAQDGKKQSNTLA